MDHAQKQEPGTKQDEEDEKGVDDDQGLWCGHGESMKTSKAGL